MAEAGQVGLVGDGAGSDQMVEAGRQSHQPADVGNGGNGRR